MCHKGVSFDVQRRWHVSLGAFIDVNTTTEHISPGRVVIGQPHGGAGAGGGSSGEDDGSIKKRCVCSPSQHPGSFRCRLHQAKYVWRTVEKN
ncbi:hypothetical protein Lal_00016486 [Lupinus albus]|uniref:Uncharacterized protein n=1 Tax=Lupinus albus TaxID=3870 RepID=A0A6A4QIF8_LUPAL|nr:hypothetical protein Lalb_Chr05g0222821 [Lupinus albus]KAF1872649.1 hypothetical protein Lal_00016486 [Lupinus albus]